jgi:hypothetical protein
MPYLCDLEWEIKSMYAIPLKKSEMKEITRAGICFVKIENCSIICKLIVK